MLAQHKTPLIQIKKDVKDMNFIDVGFANYIDADRIILIGQVDSSPIKRAIRQAKEEGLYVDVTQGRKTRAIVFSECGDKVMLTAVAVHAQTIISRMQKVKSSYVQKNIADEHIVQINSDDILH